MENNLSHEIPYSSRGLHGLWMSGLLYINEGFEDGDDSEVNKNDDGDDGSPDGVLTPLERGETPLNLKHKKSDANQLSTIKNEKNTLKVLKVFQVCQLGHISLKSFTAGSMSVSHSLRVLKVFQVCQIGLKVTGKIHI